MAACICGVTVAVATVAGALNDTVTFVRVVTVKADAVGTTLGGRMLCAPDLIFLLHGWRH